MSSVTKMSTALFSRVRTGHECMVQRGSMAEMSDRSDRDE